MKKLIETVLILSGLIGGVLVLDKLESETVVFLALVLVGLGLSIVGLFFGAKFLGVIAGVGVASYKKTLLLALKTNGKE